MIMTIGCDEVERWGEIEINGEKLNIFWKVILNSTAEPESWFNYTQKIRAMHTPSHYRHLIWLFNNEALFRELSGDFWDQNSPTSDLTSTVVRACSKRAIESRSSLPYRVHDFCCVAHRKMPKYAPQLAHSARIRVFWVCNSLSRVCA